MSASSSVGFQITSDPDRTALDSTRTGGALERPGERRCRFLYVGDLDPQATVAPADARVRSISATTFADVLREWAPALDVTVADHLGSDLRRAFAWRVDALDALTPAGLVARVPALHALAQARAAVGEAQTGRLSLEALRERLTASGLPGAAVLADAVAAGPDGGPAPAASGPSADPLDRLLGLVTVDGVPDVPAPTAAPSALDALVGAAVGERAATGIDAAAAERAAAGLDARLRAQTVALLDHPDVRRMEAAWRGLQFLVDRLAFRRGARLDVLAATKADLDETLYHAVVLPEHAEGEARDPLAAVIVAHDVEATSADLTLLSELAASGASLQVPVVISAGSAFFGLAAPTDFSRLPPVAALLEQPPYAAFQSLRKRPDASYLALAVPPFVLRPPYGPALPDRAHGVEGGETLWGGGALLAAAAMAVRHAETGWPTPPTGYAVEGLPVRTTRMGAMPLAAAFSESILQDLARAGVTGFAGPLNTDRALLGPPALVGRPADASHEAAVHARLPVAAFSALAAHEALRTMPAIAGMDAEPARAAIEARFRAWMHTGGPAGDDAVTVQYLSEHDTETSRTFGVRLRPPAAVLPGGVGVVFGLNGATVSAPDAA